MSALERIVTRVVEAMVNGLERILSYAFMCIVVLELINLALRIVGKGIPQEGDIGALAVFLVCFLGIAAGFLRGSHVRFTWVLRKLPPDMAKLVGGIGWLASLVALCIIAWYGLVVTIRFYSMYLPTVSMPWFPTWLPMAAMPLGALLSIAAILVYLRRNSLVASADTEESIDA